MSLTLRDRPTFDCVLRACLAEMSTAYGFASIYQTDSEMSLLLWANTTKSLPDSRPIGEIHATASQLVAQIRLECRTQGLAQTGHLAACSRYFHGGGLAHPPRTMSPMPHPLPADERWVIRFSGAHGARRSGINVQSSGRYFIWLGFSSINPALYSQSSILNPKAFPPSALVVIFGTNAYFASLQLRLCPCRRPHRPPPPQQATPGRRSRRRLPPGPRRPMPLPFRLPGRGS